MKHLLLDRVTVAYDADPVVSDLIRQRGYSVNEMREHQLELDITAEARNEIQGALKLESALRKLGPSFDGELKSMKTASQRLSLKVSVGFGRAGQ